MSTTDGVEHVLFSHALVLDDPFPKERTRRSSTPFTDGKSCLLWRTCVTAAAVGLFITRPPSTAEHKVLPSTEAKLNGLKWLGVADVARHTFQSSKSKLGDSDASAREKTKGAELLRSKQGIRSGLHVSFKVNNRPSSFLWNTCFNTLSMLLEENFRRRRNTPPDLNL
ncbi:hypothetical protein V8G54_029782 [Vigna mungo]|uniref:Uncharacterized protein n=1 Tax=Vigna mungo TaxID=3915 RepID=A0AAQ3RKN3_VIGMU